ncbi:response regulator transcription factor [Salsuginibacillus halophilus]|uniref:response regulator transcription factor n=1 Tax=Salsuginibacillus halophilus TaxID=517424 RepID=UPI000D0D9FC4|nr:response regulator transcription factor [Salsuginibacillus halophilus]
MGQQILVVEDDEMIRNLIQIYLEKHHYEVITAADGEEGREAYLAHYPCLVLLDLMLPKLSGEKLCEWIQEQDNNETSIIMLTAKTSSEQKVAGLRLGADDYITKPFSPEELVARVEAVLRRGGRFCQRIAHSGLVIMPRRGEVYLYEQPLKMTTYEFHLLYHFMSHPNIVFSREQLVAQIHPDDEADILERTIDAHIKKLREKIEETPAKPARIQTVRGMGYRFVP